MRMHSVRVLAPKVPCTSPLIGSTVHEAGMADAQLNEDEGIWRRRVAKRLASVRAAKASPAYASCSVRPATPDPFDHTVSKRSWERSMHTFRRNVREQAPRIASDASGALESVGPPFTARPAEWSGAMAVEEPPPADLVSETPICGRDRYELERCDSDALLWRGLTARDT